MGTKGGSGRTNNLAVYNEAPKGGGGQYGEKVEKLEKKSGSCVML